MVTPDPCPLCAGTLQATHTPEHDGATGYFYPCPKCLTIPATPEIRRVAREWVGFRPWGAFLPGEDAGSVDQWFTFEDDGVAHTCLPLYLGMGQALGLHVLAGRVHLDASSGLVWREDEAGWRLENGWSEASFASTRHAALAGYAFPASEYGWVEIPALATIPADAPPNLRTGRAIALALLATTPEEEG